VPFSIPEVYGVGEAHGVATADGGGLVLEFEIKDSLVGALRSGVKEVRIPLAEIASVKARSNPFWTTLVVQTRSLSAASRVPKSEGGRFSLRVRRRDAAAAREAEELLALGLARKEVEDLSGDLRGELEPRRDEDAPRPEDAV
jgi:hypothetical protein